MGALKTYSMFYYGIRITTDSRFLNFKEGAGPELTAILTPKGYTLEEIAGAVQTALNDQGSLEYTVTVDRATRQLLIEADGTFSLLCENGTNVGQSAYGVIGFPELDVLSVTSALSPNPVGLVYKPQLILQSYVPPENNRRALNAVVSKSASGKNVTVQTFGEERFVEFVVQYITNIQQPFGQRIRNNPTGVEEALSFLDFISDKEKFEFMPNEEDPSTFYTVLAESIGDQRDGTGYKLREYYDRGLPYYFETGLITLKVIE